MALAILSAASRSDDRQAFSQCSEMSQRSAKRNSLPYISNKKILKKSAFLQWRCQRIVIRSTQNHVPRFNSGATFRGGSRRRYATEAAGIPASR
jgi:hypothetical protein